METTPSTPQCANAADSSRFHAKAGTTYRIVVVEYVDPGSFTLALSAPAAPANDDFADAQSIGSLPVRIAATTTDTTVEPGEEGYFGSPGDAQSVWYRWTAPKDTRIWFDDCGQDFGTRTQIYRGASLNTLTPVSEQFAGTPEGPANCHDLYPGANASGEVSAFMAKAGTTYRFQVLLDDINLDPDFHLGLREARFDGSISQASSAKSIRKGKTVTYTVTVRNLGTLPMAPEVELITSKPHKLARPVVGTRYVSLDPSQGRCRRVKFFAVHPGAICDPGKDRPGQDGQDHGEGEAVRLAQPLGRARLPARGRGRQRRRQSPQRPDRRPDHGGQGRPPPLIGQPTFSMTPIRPLPLRAPWARN